MLWEENQAVLSQHRLMDIVVLSKRNEWLSLTEKQSSFSDAAIQKAVEEYSLAK